MPKNQQEAETAHFIKEIVSRPVYVNGSKVPFEEFGRGSGGIVTNNKFLIEQLTKLADQRKGGVIKVTAEEYDAYKKKLQKLQPTRRSVHVESRLQVWGAQRPKSQDPAVVDRALLSKRAPTPAPAPSPAITVPDTRVPVAKKLAPEKPASDTPSAS